MNKTIAQLGQEHGLLLPLTNRCNLNCSYCNAQKDGRSMTFAIAKKALSLARKLLKGDMGICYAGGEPLLEWELLKKIFRYSKRKYNIRAQGIMTNCTLLDAEKIAFMLRNQLYPVLSLDGLPDAHDKHRTCGLKRGTYKEIKPLLQQLKDLGGGRDFPAYIRMTLTPDAVNKMALSLKFILEIFEGENVHIRVVPEMLTSRWNAGHYETFRRELKEAGPLLRRGARQHRLDIVFYLNPGKFGFRSPAGKKPQVCRCRPSLSFDPSGNIFPCGLISGVERDKYRMGNVFDKDLGAGTLERFSGILDETCQKCSSYGAGDITALELLRLGARPELYKKT